MLKIGLGSPQYGLFTDPATISGFAAEVETIGYDSLWVGDRALVPTQPRDPYPGGGPVPDEYRAFLDPIATLSFLAHATSRLRLGTSTLNAPFYSPLLLARSLTTVDILSGGRLDIGFGLGWSSDEYEAIGVPWPGRGARMEEILDVLDHVWSGTEAEHKGELWTIPSAHIETLPVQRPRPPVLLGGFTPATLERIGRRADGWAGVALPVPQLAYVISQIRQSAEANGRDPDALRTVVRVNPVVTAEDAPSEAVPHRGTVVQVSDHLLAAHAAGADEVLIDLQQTARDADELTDLAHRFHEHLRKG
ncbi:TIGR03619 family F420-dependent LLM class oxidoreductase [Streptomyces sp. MBT65]|uniref:TIGR03619 family F420-dependent LLM class oxidoreductase n=1 Tax=Streptomyces sp. MBT65 TaxID=1488395 RepID=UPI00190A65CA|nr:TIGR03619 family F420-dependent LLM class oxidoreductase [Streptomyces sp. MBT65]MBK3575907.1 TIGR03619 family F420-dependent LLM class oxidoreductase [Streptomyces sp. MBT65]